MPDPYEGKSRVTRPVSFNPRDRTQRMLLEYIDRPDVNYSGLVKNLLFAYLMGRINLEGSIPSPSLRPRARTSDQRLGRDEQAATREIPPPASASPTVTPAPAPKHAPDKKDTPSNPPPDFGGMPVDF